MTRADLYRADTVDVPRAALILCPGRNGNGKSLADDPVWRAFAKEHDLGLVGISFASESADLRNGRGYYNARHGSGGILLDGIQRGMQETA
jgi:hypothetical protein